MRLGSLSQKCFESNTECGRCDKKDAAALQRPLNREDDLEWPPRTLCNGDDRGQWPKQGGAVGAAACKIRVPLQGTKQMQGAATRIFSAEIS